MLKFISKILFIIIPVFYLFYCESAKQRPGDNAQPLMYLAVSKDIKKNFPFITEKNYQGKEIDRLFDTMTIRGNEFCKMLYGMKKFDMKKAQRFIAKSKLARFRRMSQKGTIYTLTAGCWNFFVLNDTHPNRDFELVRKLYPQKQFDCFSVGMLQPYMMHNALSCQTLTMLDIDWRILDGHRQLLKFYNKKMFGKNQKLSALLSKMTLGWVAFSRPLKPEQPVTLDLLCQRYQHALCKKEMRLFQKKYPLLKAVQLNLAGLHDGSYIKSHDKTTIVVFLSNAIESYYCTKKQFDQMIEKIRVQLKENEKAILIYHVGGRPQMGIYELVKTKKKYRIRTVCKDRYLSDTVGGKKVKEYKTYLEYVSFSKKRVPLCGSLYRKLK